jgi:hypothetical protein
LELDNEHNEQLLIALKALKESVLEHGVQLEPRCDRWSIEKGVEWLFHIFDPQRFPKLSSTLREIFLVTFSPESMSMRSSLLLATFPRFTSGGPMYKNRSCWMRATVV